MMRIVTADPDNTVAIVTIGVDEAFRLKTVTTASTMMTFKVENSERKIVNYNADRNRYIIVIALVHLCLWDST